MVCTYYGLTCFKMQVAENILAIDPFGKGEDFSPPRFEAHVVLLSHPDTKQDFSISGNPLILSTPGEYETRSIILQGTPTPETTAFLIEWEGMKTLHLGNIRKSSSIEPLLEHNETIDILMASTAGDPSEVQKIINRIDPRIVILMQGPGAKKGSTEAVAKELGEKIERLDKLSIKKKMLPTEGQRLLVLGS